ncbi:MAG: hypothetical protein JO011_10410 [Ktedonobacteraceae bacterium]|nr:hypothetical protein [Ktedonobacteraceae bacterium]
MDECLFERFSHTFTLKPLLFTILRIIRGQENRQAKQDLVLLLQKLGIWPLDGKNQLEERMP